MSKKKIEPIKKFLFPDKTDQPFDTWNEIWLAWIGIMLTSLVIIAILSMLK